MADLKIAKLEAEIEGYVIEFKNATVQEDKKIYASLINTARQTLNILLEEKKFSPPQGSGVLFCVKTFYLYFSLTQY